MDHAATRQKKRVKNSNNRELLLKCSYIAVVVVVNHLPDDNRNFGQKRIRKFSLPIKTVDSKTVIQFHHYIVFLLMYQLVKKRNCA